MLQIVEYIKARMASTERGAAAVEYALLIALIAVLIVGAVAGLQGKISDAFNSARDAI